MWKWASVKRIYLALVPCVSHVCFLLPLPSTAMVPWENPVKYMSLYLSLPASRTLRNKSLPFKMFPALGILLEQYKMNEEIHIEKEKVNNDSFEKPTSTN